MQADDCWAILFDPNLPTDMRGEIIHRCAPPVLPNLVRVNKVWHKLVQNKLDARLEDNLTYYVSRTFHIPSLNWLGRYTCGSSFFRGTRVRVREENGVELRLDGLPYDFPEDEDEEEEEEEEYDNSTRTCYDIGCFDHNCAFWDDRLLLRLSHPEELLEAAKGGHRELGLVTSREQVENLISLIANHSDPVIRQYDPTPLLDKMRQHAEESPEGGIFYAWKDYSTIYQLEGDTFVFVRNMTGFLDEIRRVIAIGERQDITFEWILHVFIFFPRVTNRIITT
jgi:hypothetical protein